MVHAVLRLFALTLILIILALFAVVGLRWMGYQQSFQPPHHPWFERTFWAVYTPELNEICTGKNLDQSPDEKWIVEIPVRLKSDSGVSRGDSGTWTIPCSEPVALKDFLARTSRRDLLLNVEARDTWSLDELVQIASAFDKSKHFAVATHSQKVAAYLRKKAPQWLFAADGASLLRMRTFSSFWIETAIDFWPDFAIADLQAKDLPQIDQRMALELERRQKRILLKWNEGDAETTPFPIQGIMTGRPSAAQKIWAKSL